jgi:hypothetical protein
MISSSRSSPTNTQTSVTEVQNLNLQDTEGVTLANSSNNVITTTDYGAIDRAADISGDALNLGREALLSNESLSRAALGSVENVAIRSNESIERFAGDTLASNRNLLESALDFASDLFGTATSATQKAVDTNISGLQSIAQKNSESADDRVTRVALYAFAAIAAVFILPGLMSKLK